MFAFVAGCEGLAFQSRRYWKKGFPVKRLPTRTRKCSSEIAQSFKSEDEGASSASLLVCKN